MAPKKQNYIKGPFTHRRTEADYMGVLLDTVTLEDWRRVVVATLAAAKAGDPSARAWLGQYLVGKPAATAPAPLTVAVQQLIGRDPLVDRLAKPHIDRAEYPSLHAHDDFEDAIKSPCSIRVAGTGGAKIRHARGGRKRRRYSAFGELTSWRGSSPINYGKIQWVGRVAAIAGATTLRRRRTITAF
jgi:hypothetical protein